MSDTTPPFDDELSSTETIEAAIDRGEEMARERAQQDAPDDFCAACVEYTPLAYENASDAHTIRFMREMVDAVVEQIGVVEGDGVDEYAIEAELNDVYMDAYYEACPAPAACEVCTHPEAYDECGHERHGEPCPARQ